MSCLYLLLCFVVFSDGSGDKKAATSAGAYFNPEFVSVCSILSCLSLSPPPPPPPLSPPLPPFQLGGFGRGKPMGAGLGAPL